VESAAAAAAAATTAAVADAAAGASQTEPHLKHAPRLKDRPAYNALFPQQTPPPPHPSPFCFINLKPQTGCASRSPRQCRNKLPGREANLPVHHASAETSFPYGKPTFPFTTPVQKHVSRTGSQASRMPRLCTGLNSRTGTMLPVHHASAETCFPYGKPGFPYATPVHRIKFPYVKKNT